MESVLGVYEVLNDLWMFMVVRYHYAILPLIVGDGVEVLPAGREPGRGAQQEGTQNIQG